MNEEIAQQILKETRPKILALIGDEEDTRLEEILAKQTELYHYTDLDGLLGILESRTLWFSNVLFMNDPLDTQYGLKFLSEYLINRIVNHELEGLTLNYYHKVVEYLRIGDFATRLVNRTYAFSMTLKYDDLNQYRNYADGGRGFCIGVSENLLSEILEKTNEESGRGNFDFRRIIYEPLEQNEILDKVCNEFDESIKRMNFESTDIIAASIARCIAEFLFYVVSSFKQPGFRDESEYRVVLTLGANFEGSLPNVTKKDERVGQTIKTRYEVTLDSIPIEIGPIVMGPKVQEDLQAYLGVCEQLAQLGVDNPDRADGKPRIRFSSTSLQ